MDALHAETLTLVLFALPVAASAAIALIREAARRGQPVLGDVGEKLVMGAMLLPVAAGVAVLLAPPLQGPLSELPLLPGGFDDVVSVTTQTLVHAAKAGPDLAAGGANALLGLLAAGAVIALGRLAFTHHALRRIVAAATPAGDGVVQTDAAVPAFAWDRRRIVLPSSLAALSVEERGLIIAHERAHLARRDPLWFLTLSVIEAAFWFNPLVSRQARACRLAAELACDAAVISSGRTTRKAYAQTLITALKLTAAGKLTCVPAAGAKDAYRLRVGHILTPARPPKAIAWLLGGLLLIVPVAVAQFAFAKGTPAPLAAVMPVSDAPVPVAPAVVSASGFAIPVDGQLGDGFGMREDPNDHTRKFHEGIDFIAPPGTPVTASAGGTVTFAGERAGYGTVVEIDHPGNMHTRYAHLSRTDVTAGDTVTAGQLIGAVGNTGKSTMPHLHFEIWLDGRPQNPANYLALPQS